MKKLLTKDGRTICRVSRWIKVQNAYNVTKRHSLHDYATDGRGYQFGNINFDPSGGTFVDYFVWHGRKWALDQFLRFGSMFCPHTILWDEGGKTHYMAGFDRDNYFNPIMIEMDDCGEYVRVYEEE